MGNSSIISNQNSFKYFLLKNNRIKFALYFIGFATVIHFIIFKYYYPFANYIHGDSFSYIRAADENANINTYLIGYSKFLRLFSVFSRSDLALTCFQYLSIQISIFFLLFTIFYFFKLSNVVQMILLGFSAFNPLSTHLANLVSSDCLFAALSFIWFTLLLWIIYKPSPQIFILHALVLLIAFTFRYNALIYPFISGVAFLMTPLKWHKIIIWYSMALFLCGSFVAFTQNEYKKLTGIRQYSPFSGWQLANNALYTYRYVSKQDRKPVPIKFKGLDYMVQEYFDSTRDKKKYPYEYEMASTVYMWTPELPLYKYRDLKFGNIQDASEFKMWASIGPFYKDYGLYIITKYPWHFLRYFVWPNANNYYAPPVEFLKAYNSGVDSVTRRAKTWFNYKSQKVTTRTGEIRIRILDFFPILSGATNMIMCCCILAYLLLKNTRSINIHRNVVLLVGSMWIINAGFSIFASTPALRFQTFPILLAFIFSLCFIDFFYQAILMTELRYPSVATGICHDDNFANSAQPPIEL